MGYSLADPAVAAVTGAVRNSIKISNEVLDLFKEEDRYIPTDEFKILIRKLDEHKSSYSKRAGELASEVKSLLKDAMAAYFMSTQSVYEWCGIVVKRLQTYLDLHHNFSKTKAKMQQRIIIEVLDQGLKKMSAAQQKLNEASRHFNKVSGRITALTGQLNADFDEKGDVFIGLVNGISIVKNVCFFWFCGIIVKPTFDEAVRNVRNKLQNIQRFHEELKESLVNADNKIDETKLKLQDEITVIGNVKTQAMVTASTIDDIIDFDEFDKDIQNEIRTSVEELIEESRRYRERHNDQKESFF